MKNTRKILSLLLCFCILLSMQVFALEFPDVEDSNKNGEAIDVLSSLGIIKGYDDGQFKPDKEVTRAELTSLLMRLLNLSITGTTVADSGYTDVANNHWAVYDIKTASSMGIIKGFGDGNFGPEASVTFEQAVKMVVCMLGYESIAIEKGGWPDGYVTQGLDLGLLKNAEMPQTDAAPRKIIAQILYNALEVDLMAEKKGDDESKSYYIKNGQNLLTEYMKIEKIDGMVTATSTTRLDNLESQLADDQIEITSKNDAEQYKVGNFESAKSMLGLSVIAYVKYDEYNVHKIIQHMMPKARTEILEFKAEEIDTFTAQKIKIINNDTGKTTDYKISDDAVYMYNGKAIDADYLFDNKLAKPVVGFVRLIDSGSGYNYIEIESYKNYRVKSVDTSAYLIYVDNSVGSVSEATISVPVDSKLDYVVSIKKGTSEVSLSSIRKDNIISVKQTIPEEQIGIQNIEILVSDTKKSGKITEEDSEYVKIDGTKYTISPFIAGTDLAKKIVYNANGTFYIDAFDSIYFAEFSTGGAYKYAYVINAGIKSSSGDGNEANIRLFDYSTSSVKLYDFHTRVTVNGENVTNAEELMRELKKAADNFEDASDESNGNDDRAIYDQPIKYLVNNQGKISEIVTVESETDTSMQNIGFGEECVYNSTNKFFTVDGNNVKVDSKTIIFEIPKDRFDNNGYAKRSYSYFKNKFPYEIHAIGENESGAANIILAYEPNVDKDVYYNTPTYIVKDMKDVSIDDEYKTRLTLINFQTGSEETIYCAHSDYIEDVEIGDVIRFGKEINGDINENVYIYLDISEAKKGNYPDIASVDESSSLKAISEEFKPASNYPFRSVLMAEDYTTPYRMYPMNKVGPYYSYIFATPYSVSENDFELTDLIPGEDGFDTDADDDGVMDKPASIANFSASSSTMFYSINNDEITVTKGVSEENDIMGTILSYKDHPDTNDFVYTYIVNESLKAVYIIKQN